MAHDLAQTADDDLARLDERLASSPIREGWISRTHFSDACASIWLEGDLVPVEDLVLHDSFADIRPPTHELTRARSMLEARRRILNAPPGWAMTRDACDALLGHGGGTEAAGAVRPLDREDEAGAMLDSEFAAIDALLARSSRLLSRHAPGATDHPQERGQGERFDQWRDKVAATAALSPVRAAATALIAWQDMRPIDNADWLGRLLVADLLRTRRKTRSHLCTLNIGLKSLAQASRRSKDPAIRLDAAIQGFALAAEAGLRDHDRWRVAIEGFAQTHRGRRSTSHMPQLIEFVMARPLVTSASIAKELRVSERSARDLVAALGLRELTGRGRYRAWGIL